jgi:DNA polymerase I-like protein with 3'-5' exonuclease and polymerase domains
MQDRVKEVIKARGYVKNYFGRRYKYPADLAYIGLNAIIQGSAADLFKQKLVKVFKTVPKEVELVDMIYDSCLSVMPIEIAQEYWETSQLLVCDTPFKVPVLIDGEVALYNWANITKIQNNDVLGSAALICQRPKKK